MERENNSKKRLHTFIQMSKNITSNSSLNELIKGIISDVIDATEKADAGFLLLWDEEEQLLRIEAAVNFKEEMYLKNTLLSGEGISGKVFESGKSMLLHAAEISDAMSNMRHQTMEYYLKSTINTHMPISCVSVPLTHLNEKIGVLTIDNFLNDSYFDDEDVEFLEAIGHQIAISIVNARAYYEKQNQANQLEKILSYHNRLNKAALKENALQSIVKCLGVLIKGRTYYFDSLLRIECSSSSGGGNLELLAAWLRKQDKGKINASDLYPIQIEEDVYGYALSIESSFGTAGYLVVELRDNKIDSVKELVIKHAVSLIAMERLKFQEQTKHAMEEKGAILKELLNHNLTSDVQSSLIRYGMPVTGKYCFLSVTNNCSDSVDVLEMITLENELARLYGENHSIMTFLQEKSILVFMNIKDTNKDPKEEIQSLSKRLLTLFPDHLVKTGRIVRSLQHVSISYRDIDYESLGKNGIETFKDIGFKRYLMHLNDDEARYFVEEMLDGILLQTDVEVTNELLETLKTYLHLNKSVGKTADALHVHPNTIYYRLQQLRNQLDCDFDDWEQIMNLNAALFLYERNSIRD